MYRRAFCLMLIPALALFMSTTVLAKDGASQPARKNAKSYVVVLANDSIAAYKGDIAGYLATKPAKGDKVNPNSAHVRKYEMFLKKNHDKSLAAAGVATSAKVHDYAFALNGYSAILTEAEVEVLKSQVGVVAVLEDQVRYKDTDSSPTFLGLTAFEGPWDKNIDGKGVVVGVIDTGIWPEHPSFADDGMYRLPPVVLDDSRPNCEFGNTDHNPNDAPLPATTS